MAKLEFKNSWFNRRKSRASSDVGDAEETYLVDGKQVKQLATGIEENQPLDDEGNPLLLKGYVNTNNWNIDMARVYHFTVQIDQIPSNLPEHSIYTKFLPVSKFKYAPVGINSEDLEIGSFSKFPLPVGREIGTLDITLVDTADRYYEKQVAYWYARSAPSDGYAPYISDIVGLLTYRSYNPFGTQLTESKLVVIPTGSYEIERDPKENELNAISFQVAVIGVYSELSDRNI